MSQMLTEAEEAPSRVQALLAADREIYRALGARLRRLEPEFVATIARGSSDHAAGYAAHVIPQLTGRLVCSLPPSLVTVANASLLMKNQFVLSLSQSGASPDILSATLHAKEQGAITAAIVNQLDSPLARSAEVILPQHAGTEIGVAATKTVLCSMVSVARLAGEWSEDEGFLEQLQSLPPLLESAFSAGLHFDENVLNGLEDAFVLSRSAGESVAREVALKMKETCGVHAEAFSTAEVRHGPKEIVSEKYLVLALVFPGPGAQGIVEAALELKAQGARVVLVGAPELSAHALPVLSVPGSTDEKLLPMIYLQALYPWMARVSRAVGRDPDRPKHLKSKIVRTM